MNAMPLPDLSASQQYAEMLARQIEFHAELYMTMRLEPEQVGVIRGLNVAAAIVRGEMAKMPAKVLIEDLKK